MQNSLGKHVLLEVYGCEFDILNDAEKLCEVFKEAIEKAKMTLLFLNDKQFEPFGVTVVAVLSESHMSIHTYPELGYAAVDVFTCGDTGDPMEAIDVLVAAIKPSRKDINFIARGTDIRESDKHQKYIEMLKDK